MRGPGQYLYHYAQPSGDTGLFHKVVEWIKTQSDKPPPPVLLVDEQNKSPGICLDEMRRAMRYSETQYWTPPRMITVSAANTDCSEDNIRHKTIKHALASDGFTTDRSLIYCCCDSLKRRTFNGKKECERVFNGNFQEHEHRWAHKNCELADFVILWLAMALKKYMKNMPHSTCYSCTDDRGLQKFLSGRGNVNEVSHPPAFKAYFYTISDVHPDQSVQFHGTYEFSDYAISNIVSHLQSYVMDGIELALDHVSVPGSPWKGGGRYAGADGKKAAIGNRRDQKQRSSLDKPPDNKGEQVHHSHATVLDNPPDKKGEQVHHSHATVPALRHGPAQEDRRPAADADREGALGIHLSRRKQKSADRASAWRDAPLASVKRDARVVRRLQGRGGHAPERAPEREPSNAQKPPEKKVEQVHHSHARVLDKGGRELVFLTDGTLAYK